ncbi:hypothetical protein pdam_00015944 [Pocillopora damicornis]|uniref:Uncharacterized protein n=1 Tax=Pocillopora damicornis TaxID=46731 RepID=A0A3M6THE9_POCDA|nr:hypothetical protein pdam_00015944 [Pocillopora damicornis]
MTSSEQAPEEGPWEQLNNLSRNAFSESLMADQTGNYISSFKMTGGVLMFVFVIPFALIFIKRRKSSSQSNSASQEKFVPRKQQTLLLEQM